MNRANDLSEFFERRLGHVVVAKGNVEIHVASRIDIALWAGAYGTELDFAAVETKCPCHLESTSTLWDEHLP